MNTLEAFSRGAANRGNEMMVFDWHKAARILRERRVQEASAGLRDDWEWTGGDILRDGKPLTSRESTYLGSTWAVPELDINGEIQDCFIMGSEQPTWNSETFWPASALAIFEGRESL